MAEPTSQDELKQIRCSSCGRFLGKGKINDGELYLLCKNCKNWTVILEGERELSITGKEIYKILEQHDSKPAKIIQ